MLPAYLHLGARISQRPHRQPRWPTDSASKRPAGITHDGKPASACCLPPTRPHCCSVGSCGAAGTSTHTPQRVPESGAGAARRGHAASPQLPWQLGEETFRDTVCRRPHTHCSGHSSPPEASPPLPALPQQPLRPSPRSEITEARSGELAAHFWDRVPGSLPRSSELGVHPEVPATLPRRPRARAERRQPAPMREADGPLTKPPHLSKLVFPHA